MKIDVVFFGELAELIGSEKLSFSNVIDLLELQKNLENTYPPLKNKFYKIAINQQIVTENCKLNNMDEIALLPAYSGG